MYFPVVLDDQALGAIKAVETLVEQKKGRYVRSLEIVDRQGGDYGVHMIKVTHGPINPEESIFFVKWVPPSYIQDAFGNRWSITIEETGLVFREIDPVAVTSRHHP